MNTQDAGGRHQDCTQTAVYFDRGDYAGPIRRAAIVCIDLVAAFVLALGVLVGVWYIWLIRHPEGDYPPGIVMAMPLLAVYMYFTVVKRSRVRSLGYVLAGVRIVNIEGKRPSLLQMTIRMLPLPPVPWSLLFDLGWILDEPARQTLRDKWAGTFVVRRKARPAGHAGVRFTRICFAGVQLIVPEIAGRPHEKAKDLPEPPAISSDAV